MFQSFFNLCEIVPAWKKSVSSISCFLKYSQFYIPKTRLVTLIFDHAPTSTLNQLLIFVNLYHHAKNEAASSICSGEIFDLKVLQFEWLRAFWTISHEQQFFHIEDLYRKTTNNVNFHYRANSGIN